MILLHKNSPCLALMVKKFVPCLAYCSLRDFFFQKTVLCNNFSNEKTSTSAISTFVLALGRNFRGSAVKKQLKKREIKMHKNVFSKIIN